MIPLIFRCMYLCATFGVENLLVVVAGSYDNPFIIPHKFLTHLDIWRHDQLTELIKDRLMLQKFIHYSNMLSCDHILALGLRKFLKTGNITFKITYGLVLQCLVNGRWLVLLLIFCMCSPTNLISGGKTKSSWRASTGSVMAITIETRWNIRQRQRICSKPTKGVDCDRMFGAHLQFSILRDGHITSALGLTADITCYPEGPTLQCVHRRGGRFCRWVWSSFLFLFLFFNGNFSYWEQGGKEIFKVASLF